MDIATASDSTLAVDTLPDAFIHDPTWPLSFHDAAARKVFWMMSVEGAIRYPWVFKTQGLEVVSVWNPPERSEFLPDDEENLSSILIRLVGERTADAEELINRFGAAHPRHEQHYYLSLLGTQTSQHGKGLGMALRRENLSRIDALHMSASLESSNPFNDHRYESFAFTNHVIHLSIKTLSI